MTMRGLAFVFSAAFCAAAFAAEKVEGDYNTSLGYLAGKDATGNRATVMGAGAGGEATGIRRTDFMGAAAGAYSRNVRDSVGVGYRAMRDAANCSNVVAIGTQAFAGETNLSSATWLNGHFVARGGSFYITANAASAGPAAPIYYADGTLHLNAARIVTGGGEIVSGGGSSTGSSASYDWYVSAENGSDEYDGRSPSAPFASIEKAWNAASDGDAVAVSPGAYAAPYGLHVDMRQNSLQSIAVTNKSVDIYALEGPDRTTLDGCGRAIVGSMYRIPIISGFTVRNLGTCAYASGNADNKASLVMAGFVGCRMAWTNELSGQPSNVGAFYSVFQDCDVSAASIVTNYIGGQGYNNFFQNCDFLGCRVEMAPVDGLAYKFGQRNSVFDSFVRLDGARDVGFWMDGKSALGYSTTWESSTLVATNCTWNKTGTPAVTWRDCLVAAVPSGIGTWPAYKLDGTLVADLSAVSFGSDLRPAAPLYAKYYGYGSSADRAARDTLVSWLEWQSAATNTASAAESADAPAE